MLCETGILYRVVRDRLQRLLCIEYFNRFPLLSQSTVNSNETYQSLGMFTHVDDYSKAFPTDHREKNR